MMHSLDSQKLVAAANQNDLRPGILRDGQVILNPGRRRLQGGETAIVIGTSQAAVDHALSQKFTAAPPLKAVSPSGDAVSMPRDSKYSSDDVKVRCRVLVAAHTSLGI